MHCHLINDIGLKFSVLGAVYKNAWSVKTKLENLHVESLQTRADYESQQQINHKTSFSLPPKRIHSGACDLAQKVQNTLECP